jgi:DNA-binding MarR family transcriptional regulator
MAAKRETTRAAPATGTATTDNLGFLLAKASARWNALLTDAFTGRGYPEVRASYGSVLLPLFAEDGLRMSDLTRRARLAKQTMTTLIRQIERAGLVERRQDTDDARASRVHLTERGRAFKPVAEEVLLDLDAHVAEHLSRATTAKLRSGLRRVMDL